MKVYYCGLHKPEQRPDSNIEIEHFPLIRTKYENLHISALISALESTGIIVFTSAVAVKALKRITYKYHKIKQEIALKDIWCIGSKTAGLFEKDFHKKVNTPLKSSGKGLCDSFSEMGGKHSILHLAARNAHKEIENWCLQSDWSYTKISLYKTETYIHEAFKSKLINDPDTILVMTSPSVVDSLCENLEIQSLQTVANPFVSLGDLTSETLFYKDAKNIITSSPETLYDDLTKMELIINE